jgi:hypothetical protein
MKNINTTATTVKIEKNLYSDFKVHSIRSGSTLQDFVEKCVHLYLSNEPFREIVNNFQIPRLSADASDAFNTTVT